MSENKHLHLVAAMKKTDARVRRTRDALGDALVALMQEKPFDTITVQDVLDRANISRSTFYMHYSDKDDLLMSDAEEFFEAISMALSEHGDKSDRVFPVQEFFTHLAEVQPFFKALVKSGKFQENMDLARGHFARGIERRLAELPRSRSIPPSELPAIAFAHAGALLSLLTWWLDRGMRESPAEMDQLFHHMVWNGLSSTR
ncbi:MAG TPA: TetR/AcrR family transcriptional regulator [Pyrinomonadaceae bacterium]|jgi:AcrR family transcriptional regulator|nr:TetR/AcrR family transcriptional regulator [Pyrinomonadaceae bacterium]